MGIFDDLRNGKGRDQSNNFIKDSDPLTPPPSNEGKTLEITLQIDTSICDWKKEFRNGAISMSRTPRSVARQALVDELTNMFVKEINTDALDLLISKEIKKMVFIVKRKSKNEI